MPSRNADTTIGIGATLMLLAVLLGAFGAHTLKTRLTPEMLAVYQTGVQYHLVHALGLMLIGVMCNRQLSDHGGSRLLKFAAVFMGAGIVLFSGSLYALAITGMGVLGAVTPLGGVFFMVAWALVAWQMLRRDGLSN